MKQMLSLTHPIHIVGGVTIWGIWFVVIYGGLSVACIAAPPPAEQDALTYINIWIGISTLAVTALLLWLAWVGLVVAKRTQGRERFFAALSMGLYLFSAFATLFVGYPVVFLPPCL